MCSILASISGTRRFTWRDLGTDWTFPGEPQIQQSAVFCFKERNTTMKLNQNWLYYYFTDNQPGRF
jgi:hypothetical protein